MGDDEVTIYAAGGCSDIEVIWNIKTGAVRVLPDGDWLHPESITKEPFDDPFA